MQTLPIYRMNIQDRRKKKPPNTISKKAMRETRGMQALSSTDCSKHHCTCLGPFS